MTKLTTTIIVKGICLKINGREKVMPTEEFTAFMQTYNQKIQALCDACERLEGYWADTELYDADELEKIRQALGDALKDLLSFFQA